MKKVAIVLTTISVLFTSPCFAQSTNAGRGATAGREAAENGFPWGIALLGIAVIATVVGITVAASIHSSSSS